MSCQCDSRLDSIMKFLEEMRAEVGAVKKEIEIVKEEVGTVKTKCIRIEKEFLGITANSEMNAEALMETTTVRHLVEKLAFDVNALNEESKQKRDESERQQELKDAISQELPYKFLDAISVKIKDIKLRYDVLSPKTFQTEFSKFQEEFRAQTEKVLLKKRLPCSIVHGIVEELINTTDTDELYKIHFLGKNKEMGRDIREQYGKVAMVYAKKAIERFNDFAEIGLKVTEDFLNKFNTCEKSFAIFQEELLNMFRHINEQIETNLSLLERLALDYRRYLRSGSYILPPSPSQQRQRLANQLISEINVSDPDLVPLFSGKLQQNLMDISNSFFGRT